MGGQINGCMISGNTAALEGGAVWSSGSLTLSSTTVEENHSGTTGGAWYKSSGTALVQNCTVRNNSATTVGGLWLGSGQTTILGSSFCGNGVNVYGTWTNSGGNSFAVACGPRCQGDVVPDGVVDGVDLSLVLTWWDTAGPVGGFADITGDGIVNGADLTVVLINWGPCPN